MRYCFKLVGIALVGAGLVLAAPPAQPVRKATSVVRADRRTGRLVRAVVVPRKPVGVAAAGATTPTPEPGIEALVESTAKRYEVDPLLVHSVIQVESNYNPYALSPKGAQGLMQLVPGTARRFGVSNSFDVRQNIEGGVRYLKYLHTLFPHDLRLMLAAYNAGEGAVLRYRDVPPYRETKDYVTRVGARYRTASQSAGPNKQATQTAAVIVTPLLPAEPRYAPIETYIDAEGKLSIRTKAPAERVSP